MTRGPRRIALYDRRMGIGTKQNASKFSAKPKIQARRPVLLSANPRLAGNLSRYR
jgi:hypothetical protein